MKYAPTTSYSRRVRLDIEPWQLMALCPMTHWCFGEKAMRSFELDEIRNHFTCASCGHILLVQQLIVEGRLSESKYRGIESA